jgi:RNA polymerase sigma-70 factor (ECF subfamily)
METTFVTSDGITDSVVELYDRFRKSEDKALSELEGLVGIYGANLTNFIAGIVGNHDMAKDLMIDSFVKLGLSNAEFENSAALKVYLFTIGKNLALNWLKHNNRDLQKLRPLDELLESAATIGSLDDELIKNEYGMQLNRAMGKLRREYREVLRLLYFEDASYIDVGLAMGGKTTKQVYDLVYSAKRSLRRILEREGFSYGNE